MGKTEKGAVWLDAEKTSPYEFFQYWRNVADADVIKCLTMLTFVPVEQIEEMEQHMEGAEFNKAKELLAYELTKLVHGKEEADKAKEAAIALFSGSGNSENMPETIVDAEDFRDGKVDIVTLICKAGLATTRSDARRNVEQGGVTVNGEKITDAKHGFTKEDFDSEFILKKGKKNFMKYRCNA
jgi:tyrosyl-tRNA synthetase